MQLISSSPPLPNCCNPSPTPKPKPKPKPTRLHIRHCNPTKKLQIPQSLLVNRTQAPHFRDLCAPTLAQTHFTHRPKPPDRPDPNSHSHSHRSGAGDRRDPESRSPDGDEKSGESTGLCANMWWSDMRAALGQRFNGGAIVCAVRVVARDRHLALPHVAVSDIRRIDWAELRRRGFEGVVFDKDNTITAPYSLRLWGPLAPSLERCKAVFGANIAVFSNSAGLCEYDHDGSKARALEGAIGIKVIRHRVKKPAGTAEEIEKHFGCESSQLIMVGDRPLTDIVYGNMNGFLTILTEPLSLAEEPFIVRQVRKFETSLVKYWSRRGLKPTSHRLLPEAKLCVIDPPIV